MLQRVLRAARFDLTLYDEVKDDPTALVQALAIVVLVSAAVALLGVSSSFYLLGRNPALVVMWTLLWNLTGWMVLSVAGYLPSRYLVKRDVSLWAFMRVIGFAQAPGLLNVLLLLLIPREAGDLKAYLSLLLNMIILLWIIVSVIIAYLRMMQVSVLAAFPLAVMGMFFVFMIRDFYTTIFFG